MGHYVHLHVCFSCDKNDLVAALASEHLADQDLTREARWYLEALAGRSGNNDGPKGGLSLWGIVGKGTDGKGFCEALRPFWGDLLSGEVDGGPCDFERCLVFEEHEQTERAIAHEIRWEDGEISIRRFGDLPFSWGQY